MSIHTVAYSVESLQKDKIENLEKELETQTKLHNINLNDLSNNFENFDNTGGALHIQQLTFDNGETKVLVNAKMFVDKNKENAKLASQIEDVK